MSDERGSAAADTAARTDRETTYHPALDRPAAKGMPAGKAMILVLVALLVAGLLNSAWMVRTAEGMRPGLGRTIVTTVAVPFDFVASHLSLDRPRQGVDLLLGREPAQAQSTDIEAESLDSAPTEDSAQLASSGTPVAPPPHVAPAKVARPSAAKPLKVLVLGDSLSTYTGQRLAEQLSVKKLGKVKTMFRDGTGLATPEFYNWPKWALQQIDKEKPDVVVVVLGGNDNQDMQRKGDFFGVGSPDWQAEYQRRVQVVMQAMIAHGADRVYWSGPPTSKKADEDRYFHQINQAAQAAAATVPGARYVDLAGPTSLKGQWVDVLNYGNDAFRARMGDGFHWSWKASQITARLITTAMGKEYGALV